MACAVSTEFELDAAWRLAPQVQLRPERFGALLYHFGTRQLSFLKSPALLTVVKSLGDAPSAREACRRAGLTEAELARLRSPIGLDLGARTPEETAVSIAAELIQLRWGGTGQPLTATEGRIHHQFAG